MKKLILSIITALILLSCEPITEYRDKIIYVNIIPDDPTAPDNQNIIGQWEGNGKIWDINSDYSFQCLDSADPTTVLFYGTYTMGTDSFTPTDGQTGASLLYLLEILENYPEYRDLTLRMKTDNHSATWINHIKIADD